MIFGNSINKQDFTYLKNISNKSPEMWFKNIYLYITKKCQLNCKHCYLDKRLKRGFGMSKEKVFCHLEFWRKLGGEKICFLGGEPTLHSDFEEIVKRANDLKYKIITFDTNGFNSTVLKLTSLLPSDLSYIQVSLDGGTAESNDLIRGKGMFNVVLKNIEKLCTRGFDVRIICTVNKKNVLDCLNILDIADKIGVTLVKYHIFSGIGSGKNNKDWVLGSGEWIKFYKKLAKNRGKYKSLKVQFQPSYGNAEMKDLYYKQGYRGCLGRRLDRMSIFPDGKVYICSFLFNTGLNFAKFEKGKLRIRKKFSELNLFFDKSDSNCKSCSLEGYCKGGCPAEKMIEENSACNNNYSICRLWKSEL